VPAPRPPAPAYFGDGAPAGAGGGAPGGTGGTGGTGGQRAGAVEMGGTSLGPRFPSGRDPNKYYGGEGPDVRGFPRANIPYRGQYGALPRRVYSSGAGWQRRRAKAQLEALQEQALALNPNLPVWAMTAEELLAWLAQYGGQAVGGGDAGYAARPPQFGPIVRYYRQRSEESGL